MLKKLLAAIGLRSAPTATTGPYRDEYANFIYHLLFCDRLSLFKDHHKGDVQPPWSDLFADKPDLAALKRIVEDQGEESRIRMLAFNRLRAAHEKVTKKVLLGTIIEVRLDHGLETLAVFTDRRARYINPTGKTVFVEDPPTGFDQLIGEVLEASKRIVTAIGPWEKDRLPAPRRGNVRMTFLVSDGLYFGAGPMKIMERDPLAKPLLKAATALLLKLVEKTVEADHEQTMAARSLRPEDVDSWRCQTSDVSNPSSAQIVCANCDRHRHPVYRPPMPIAPTGPPSVAAAISAIAGILPSLTETFRPDSPQPGNHSGGQTGPELALLPRL